MKEEKLIGRRIVVDGCAFYDSEAIGAMIRDATAKEMAVLRGREQTISYEIYMLDDDGKPLAKVATIDEDGKPEGFAGSIDEYARHTMHQALARAKSSRPTEKFAVERVTRERVEVV